MAGACGVSNPDSLPLVAITAEYYGGDSGRASDNCGRYVNIKNTNNGKTVTAVVADLCPTCVNGNSLDLSVGAFTSIASEADGMVPVVCPHSYSALTSCSKHVVDLPSLAAHLLQTWSWA